MNLNIIFNQITQVINIDKVEINSLASINNQTDRKKKELTRTKMIRASVDKIHKPSTAVKLSQKNGGIGLRFRQFNPLKTGTYTAIFATSFS